jgi:adenylate cyclase
MKRLLRYMLLLLLTLNCGNVLAKLQWQAKIDSLLKELPKQKEDSNKAKLLDKISDTYSYFNPGQGIKYGIMNLDLATKLGWKRGMGSAYNTLGLNYESASDYAKALECFLNEDKIFAELENKKGTGSAALNLGMVYDAKGDFKMAIDYFLKAEKIYEELQDKPSLSVVLCDLGGLYYRQSDYPKALDYSLKAIKLYEELGDKDGVGSVAGNIGSIYHSKSDDAKALEYYMKSLRMCEETGSKSAMGNANANIGGVYYDTKDYVQALEYLFRALKIFEDIQDKDGIAYATGNIGQTYARQKNYILALAYAQKALQMDEAIGDKRQIATALYQVGDAYLALADDIASNKIITKGELPTGKFQPNEDIPKSKAARLHLALNYLQRGLDTAKKIHVPDVMKDIYEAMAKAYRLNGDHKLAMESYMNFITVKDSIFSKENEAKALKTEMQNEFDKKHVADSVENAEKEKINALKLQRQRSYTYIGVVGVLLLGLFSFFMVRNNRLLGIEKKRSDDLLLNILPEEVADELKASGSSDAKHYDNVTVIFTDFVNFTQAGEKLSPKQLINELHTCFKTFDEITARHNIEKIKTIGDAYLTVAGLPNASTNHAENVVRAAIEIRDFMNKRYAHLGNSTFEIRIGINSGSVVAGIVGVKKFSYDIWGDTVNTAARMEQNSESGKINISQSTYELVKDKFNCEYRGEIEAKGKGKMKMYYVS